mmetsp:Transcript_34625/g.100384  ORF Transcript_34625/g.100384 Transcript_34625/m.100384 type:complete len:406 (+) Transcript_34625:625-1842(+)
MRSSLSKRGSSCSRSWRRKRSHFGSRIWRRKCHRLCTSAIIISSNRGRCCRKCIIKRSSKDLRCSRCIVRKAHPPLIGSSSSRTPHRPPTRRLPCCWRRCCRRGACRTRSRRRKGNSRSPRSTRHSKARCRCTRTCCLGIRTRRGGSRCSRCSSWGRQRRRGAMVPVSLQVACRTRMGGSKYRAMLRPRCWRSSWSSRWQRGRQLVYRCSSRLCRPPLPRMRSPPLATSTPRLRTPGLRARHRPRRRLAWVGAMSASPTGRPAALPSGGRMRPASVPGAVSAPCDLATGAAAEGVGQRRRAAGAPADILGAGLDLQPKRRWRPRMSMVGLDGLRGPGGHGLRRRSDADLDFGTDRAAAPLTMGQLRRRHTSPSPILSGVFLSHLSPRPCRGEAGGRIAPTSKEAL